MEKLVLCFVFCALAWVGKAQVRLDFSFGGSMNSKGEYKDNQPALGIGLNAGVGYEKKLSEKFYVCPILQYQFTNSMTDTGLDFRDVNGNKIASSFKYTIQTHSALLGCYLGFVQSKTFVELMPNFQYVSSSERYNIGFQKIGLPVTQAEYVRFLLGARLNVGYYFSEKTKCSLYFGSNLSRLYDKNSILPSRISIFGVNISRLIR